MKNLIVFLLFTFCLSAFSDINLDAPNSGQEWITIKGAPIGSYSGKVVSNIGDFNGDGIDDLLINAANSLHTEVAYVIYGQKDGYSQDTIQVDSTFSEGFTIHGPFINSVFSSFGYSISKAIDLNGDGLGDIVISAYAFNNNQGLVYVIYGKKGHTGDITINQDYSFSSSQGFVIFGPQLSQLGYSVGSAGDFNGDGFDDLLIGAPGYGSNRGAVYVIYGKKEKYTNNINLDTSQAGLTILSSTGNNCKLGTSVEGVGDINGDNIDDILLGGPNCYNVYGLYGKKNRVETSMTVDSSLDISKGFVISSTSTTGQYGAILSSAGDINGDGLQDIIIGSYVSSSSRGAYVFYGRKQNWSNFEIDGGYASNQGFKITDSRSTIASLGVAVSGGDINGDGFGDILVRARNKTSGGGYLAVIYGSRTKLTGIFDVSTDLTVDKGFIISGLDLIFQSATNGIATGDFDNDNLNDIVIGAPQSDIYAGKAYVVFGTNGCPKHCSTCESEKCLTCFGGYGLYAGACVTCPAGTSLSGGGICQAVTSAGLSCSSGSKETQAKTYKGLFDGASAISNVLSLGSSMPTNLGLVSKILRNTKYLNVSVSEDLQETFCAWEVSTGIFPAPEKASSGYGSLPLTFERYGMEKAFLINYWKSFTIILLGLVFFIVSRFAEVTFLKTSKIPRVINLMASNFVLTQFYGSIDEILFYFVLDVRSDEFTSSGFRTTGFIFGLLLLLIGLIIIGFHGIALFKYRSAKTTGGSTKFLKKYEMIKLFFKDFKDTGIFQQSFLLVNTLRSLLSSLVFILLFRYPFFQTLLLIALNLSILVYLSIKRPFKDLANAFAQYFCECILLIAYLNILVLAILDEAKTEALDSIKGLSMVVIVCNAVLLIGSAVFMLVHLARTLYQVYREHSASGKAVAPIPTDSSRKIANNMTLDYSQNLNTFCDYFQNTVYYPNIAPRRHFQQSSQPLRTENWPSLQPSHRLPMNFQRERRDSGIIQTNHNQNSYLLNSQRIHREAAFYGRTSPNRNGRGALERGDVEFHLKRLGVQRIRR